MRLQILLLSFFFLATGCFHPPTHVVATPAVPVTAPALPDRTSRVETAATIDITAPLESARAAVPTLVRTRDNAGVSWDGGNGDQGWLYLNESGQPIDQNHASYKVRAEVVLDGVDYALSGSSITYTGRFRYKLHGQKLFGVWFGGYCGTNNTPTIPLVVDGQTTVGATSDWNLTSRTHLRVRQLDPCVITVLGLEVARLTPAVQRVLDQTVLPAIAQQIDTSISAIPLRTSVEALWRRLQQPITTADMSIALHPAGFILGPITGSGSSQPAHATVTLAVGVKARPTVTVVPQAPDTGPLPPPIDSAGGGVFVEGALEVSYADVDRQLAKLRELPFKGGTIAIRKAVARAAGSGRIAVDVEFEGTGDHAFEGTATLVGAPVIDVAHQSISFPSVDFTATTDSLLLNAYLWLEKGELRERIRDALQISWKSRLPALESQLIAAASANHIHLKLDQREIAGVEFRNTIRIIAVLSGAMNVDPVVVP